MVAPQVADSDVKSFGLTLVDVVPPRPGDVLLDAAGCHTGKKKQTKKCKTDMLFSRCEHDVTLFV